MNIIFDDTLTDIDFELVERKGKGHPDTLSDDLADYLSSKYSRYTIDKFGYILHHNFDKVGLLGGSSNVTYGGGGVVSPIRVLLNGRASYGFGDERFDTTGLLHAWIKEFLLARFPGLIGEEDVTIQDNMSIQSSPGKVEGGKGGARHYWFEPRGPEDLPEYTNLFSNDTSAGVAYAPYSRLEDVVLKIENTLNSYEFKKQYPFVGSDIKIMAVRHGKAYNFTLCVPQISRYVKSAAEYKQNYDFICAQVAAMVQNAGIGENDYELHINTRDDHEKGELYLTAIGSSIESGDEGLVGRGNRINGLITMSRSMTLEGSAGKNPLYHIGKIYTYTADDIARKIYTDIGVENEVKIVSQSGRTLLDPWKVIVKTKKVDKETKDRIDYIVKEVLADTRRITNMIIDTKSTL